MSEVLLVASSLNWWLVAIIALVLSYAALVIVSLGYADGRWVPRSVWEAVPIIVGSVLWLPVVVVYLCYQVVRVLLRVAYAVVMFFFDLGDTEAAQYNHRQQAAAMVSDAREDGLPF